MTVVCRSVLVGVALLSLACGDSPTGTNPNGEIDGHLTATLGGGIVFNGNVRVKASYSSTVVQIHAIQLAGNLTRSIRLVLYHITGPGIFDISDEFEGNSAQYTEEDANDNEEHVWLAGVGIGTGQVTITQLTETQIAGTFTFVCQPNSFGAVGNKIATNGNFSIKLSN